MIYSIDIKHPTETPVKWLSEVEAFKDPRKFTFTPGLNILWGRNGSGKSTLLKLLSMLFHCEQGGVPLISQTSVSDLCDRIKYNDKFTKKQLIGSLQLTHDGQGVRFFDPGKAAGLISGSFDDDFFVAGLDNVLFKGSAGQTTMYRFAEVLEQCSEGQPPPAVKVKLERKHVNSVWQEYLDVAEAFLKGTAEKGPATILLDEPERSFDLPLQLQCWRFIRAAAKTHQVIVASHSVFALNIPEANYIEVDSGYLAASQKSVDHLATWPEEKPVMPPFKKATPTAPKKPRKKYNKDGLLNR